MPFSLLNSHPVRIGPGAAQGAKRRSGPLTARTDLESFRVRGRVDPPLFFGPRYGLYVNKL